MEFLCKTKYERLTKMSGVPATKKLFFSVQKKGLKFLYSFLLFAQQFPSSSYLHTFLSVSHFYACMSCTYKCSACQNYENNYKVRIE